MKRHTIAFAFFVAATLTVALFMLKQEVQSLKEDLFELNSKIASGQRAIHVLKAEWSHLNNPRNLKDLANRHLDLGPVSAGQLGRMVDIPRKSRPQTSLGAPVGEEAKRQVPARPASRANRKDIR